ncbi:hypothetical protein MNBD_GAMMA24-1650 [hydrothermal vent metagenome]|uniref:Uncharacterized protein n=1 Tax=hydrothermal vent metagenome TaxID=652676 RepID=A0A3B1C167_9ZZZZ
MDPRVKPEGDAWFLVQLIFSILSMGTSHSGGGVSFASRGVPIKL